MPIREVFRVARAEAITAIGLVFLGVAFWVFVVSQHASTVFGQKPPVFPDDGLGEVEQNGLDPIGQMLNRERRARLGLEERIARVERLNAIQVRQIDQLQRFTFGIGAIGQPVPIGQTIQSQSTEQAGGIIETPEELKGESVLEKPQVKGPVDASE